MKEIGIRAQKRKEKKNIKGRATKKKAAEQGSARRGRTGREASRTKGMRGKWREVCSLRPLSLNCAGQQLVSRQWNGFDTLQETYIVLYKLFPPNNNRKDWKAIEERRGAIYYETWLQMVIKCPVKNKLINCEGETLGLINHPPALGFLAGFWLRADLKGRLGALL